VQRASLLLHVSDVTSPTAAEQQAQVEEVLRELESQDKPRIYVMNKVDLLPEKKSESLCDTDSVIHVSAVKGTGLDKLLALIDAKIAEDPVRTVRLRVPQSKARRWPRSMRSRLSCRASIAMATSNWKCRRRNRCCAG